MLTINQNKNSVYFGATVPTRDVISLATRRSLSNDFVDILTATDNLTERPNNVHDLISASDKIRESLLEQFPVLKEVVKNTEKFFKTPNRTEGEIDAFVGKQIEKVGKEELDVQPVKIEEKVFQAYNSKIANEKSVFAIITK